MGEINRVAVIYTFVGVLFAMPYCLTFWSVVVRTVLVLNENGIVYRAIKLHPWMIFRSVPIEIKSSWSDVREVSWVGAPNAAMHIKTDHGVIKFWVMFHDRVNAEIMREILSRVPHLKRS
ncbi:MAG: hypothetical protein AB1451_12555 [Nitrospirota bacterium]